MFIPAYINNVSEGVRFCARYGITCSVIDGKLKVTEPPTSCRDQFMAMTEAARKLGCFVTDHPNCFLSDSGKLIATFSNYDGELTETDRQKIRRRGYDLRECGFDLYGSGTITYVMAELVSPLDEDHSAISREKLPTFVPEEPEDGAWIDRCIR